MPSVGQLLQMSPAYRAAEIARCSEGTRLSLIRLAGYAIDRETKKIAEYRELIHELAAGVDAQ